MLVGEGPGAEEDKWGRPWVGKAGRELWRYLWRSCGLSRDDVYATNLVKYRVPDDGDPTPDDIARDAPLLEKEVANVNPEVVVTLGRWSSRHFLGELDMDWCHGIPQMVGSIVVMPIVHPAAGLHSTEFQGTIAWDFEQLGKLLRGEIEPRSLVDEYPEPSYGEGRDVDGVMDLAAVDTEGSVNKPWCLSYAIVPGRSTTILARDVGDFQFCDEIVLHNAMHDIGVLRAMGIADFKFQDTMIMAYLLCVEPQGLKALAKRHCGMEMSSYEELAAGPNRKHALEYMRRVQEWLSKRSTNGSSVSPATTSRTRTKRTSARGGRKSSRTASRAKSSRR